MLNEHSKVNFMVKVGTNKQNSWPADVKYDVISNIMYIIGVEKT